jgi:outer membrane protein
MYFPYKFLLSLVVILSINKTTYAQQVLSLEEAVKIALQNNFDIRLQNQHLAISENNVSLGNAGILPNANATFGNSRSVLDSRQVRSDGSVQEKTGAKNSNLNYGVGLNWTVFDGLGMFARYEQLKELEKLGEQHLQQVVLAKITDVISSYYQLALNQQYLKTLDSNMEVSRYRLETAQNRNKVGKISGLEVLNTQVDFNTDTTSYLRQIEILKNSKIEFNQLLAQDINFDFTVSDSIPINFGLNFNHLQEQAKKQNPSLRAAIVNKRVSELSKSQAKASRYPIISLNTGYNFTNSKSALGFASQSSGKGLTYGVSASVNIFNGFNQNRIEQNAEINIKIAELELEKQDMAIQTQLATSYQTYLTNLALVKLETENQQIAKQNLEMTLNKFKIGSISQLEIRQAQQNYLNANLRFTNAQYEAKVAELALLELAGEIKVN